MTGMLATTICALIRFFNGKIQRLLKGQRPVTVSLSAETTAIVDRLKDRYSIEIIVPGEPISAWVEHGQYLTGIEGQVATSEEADGYVPLLAEEFSLYPPRLVEKAKLKAVVLCGELFRSQKPNPGSARFAGGYAVMDSQPLSFVHVSCGGVPVGEHGVLYLSVTWERDDEEHVRKLIHHEFYHCVQRQQFGSFGDLGWAALN
jgi:hypothetical protein